MKNTLPICFLLLASVFVHCKKDNPEAPENPPGPVVCDPLYKNDTLTLLYPCEGQTNCRADSFAWEVIAPMDGFFQLHISIDPNFQNDYFMYASHDWLTENRAQRQYVDKNIPLRPYTRYYWYMARRHDGNGLFYRTKVQWFETGDTPYKLPTVFKDRFPGTYLVQDTFVSQTCEYINGPANPCVTQYTETPNGAQTFTLAYDPNEQIYLSGQDTSSRMTLKGPLGEYKVGINTQGYFSWSGGNYYTSHNVSGRILGDSIAFTDMHSSHQAPIFNGHRYRGKKVQ